MPPKKGKKNAITCFIESVIVPEKQQQGYQFRNGIAALIPEASQRYKVNALLYVVPVLSLPQSVISPYITRVATNLHILNNSTSAQIRYRRILTIKLLISRNVFLHGGRSSQPSSLFLYLCLFVDVDMVTKNGCSYVLSCVKTCVVSTLWQEIPQSFNLHLQPFSIHNAFIDSQSSAVNGAIIYAWVTSFVTSYH